MDNNAPSANSFTPPIEAQYVRIYPQVCRRHCTLRMELLGCELTGMWANCCLAWTWKCWNKAWEKKKKKSHQLIKKMRCRLHMMEKTLQFCGFISRSCKWHCRLESGITYAHLRYEMYPPRHAALLYTIGLCSGHSEQLQVCHFTPINMCCDMCLQSPLVIGSRQRSKCKYTRVPLGKTNTIVSTQGKKLYK